MRGSESKKKTSRGVTNSREGIAITQNRRSAELNFIADIYLFWYRRTKTRHTHKWVKQEEWKSRKSLPLSEKKFSFSFFTFPLDLVARLSTCYTPFQVEIEMRTIIEFDFRRSLASIVFAIFLIFCDWRSFHILCRYCCRVDFETRESDGMRALRTLNTQFWCQSSAGYGSQQS